MNPTLHQNSVIFLSRIHSHSLFLFKAGLIFMQGDVMNMDVQTNWLVSVLKTRKKKKKKKQSPEKERVGILSLISSLSGGFFLFNFSWGKPPYRCPQCASFCAKYIRQHTGFNSWTHIWIPESSFNGVSQRGFLLPSYCSYWKSFYTFLSDSDTHTKTRGVRLSLSFLLINSTQSIF